MREDTQVFELSLCGEPGLGGQNLRRIEDQGAREERGIKAWRRLHGNTAQTRLVDRVPILQRSFEVALQKIDCPQEIEGIVVARPETQSGTQITLGRGKPLLFVVDAG